MTETAVLGPVCAFLSAVTWAIGSAQYARLAREHSAFAVNLSRAVVAFPIFLICAIFFSGLGLSGFLAMEPRNFGWFSVSMIASYALGDVIFLLSTRSLGVPAALAVASSYPLLTSLWGMWFQGEVLSRMQTIGLLLTVLSVGAVILTAPRLEDESTFSLDEAKAPNRKFIVGVALAFVTSFFWALNSYAVAQGSQGVNTFVGNSVRMAIGCLLCFSMGRIFDRRSKAILPVFELRRSFWLFFIEAFGGSFLYMYGLGHSSLAIGSTLVSLAPVVAVPIAWILGAEKFSFARTFSIASVVFGLWLLMGK